MPLARLGSGTRDRTWVALAVLASLAGAAIVEAEEDQGSAGAAVIVEVTLPHGVAPSGPPEGVLEVARADGEGQPVELPLRGAGIHRAVAPEDSLWRVTPRVEGYWGAEGAVLAGADAATVALYPAGEVRGELSMPRESIRPEALRVQFQAPRAIRIRSRARPEGQVECPVVEATWTCTLPAGALDLRLHSPGFASAWLWEVPVTAGETVKTPAVSLVPGAAILGWVEGEGETVAGETVQVELRPAGAMEEDRVGGERLGHLFQSVQADERGLFQFHDLAPGIYTVEATLAGRAPAVGEPVEVMAGRETELETPLVLGPPSELALFIDPPTPPGAERWSMELYALDGSHQHHSAEADWTGLAELFGVAPGRYRLTVRTRGSEWLAEEIELPAGRTTRTVDLPVVAVEGTVRRGDEPVRARLTFGNEQTRPEKVTLYSDLEGRFTGHLPGEGSWPLEVVLRHDGPKHRLEPVEVVREPGEEVAELDVALPETELEGRVVDARGRPVKEAKVLAWREGSEVSYSEASTDAEGRFDFSCLPLGRWQIDAFAGERTGRAYVELREGDTAEMEIRLSAERLIRGRVTAQAGPVAGAWIYAVPEVSRITPLSPIRSGPLGEFEEDVPADAAGVHLLVLPAGRSARLLYLPLGPEADEEPEIEIPVLDLTGTLRLELPAPGSGRVELRRGPARVPARLLADWARFHKVRVNTREAGVWTVPGMEPGPYQLCRAGECDAGILSPGGELELSAAEGDATPPADPAPRP